MKTEWAVHYPDYRYRGLIECINSIIKRLFGGNVKSRTNRNRKFEIALKCLAHNLWRLKKLNLLAFAKGVVS